MITDTEAEILMRELISLRKKLQNGSDEKINKQYKQQEQLCVEKFSYIIDVKASRYRQFNNYEDLRQEGVEALLRAMNTYNPNKGSFFWWAHKYVDTRISRCANLHTTIRFPLKYAKNNSPKREYNLPILIENKYRPDVSLECAEELDSINQAIMELDRKSQKLIKLFFGLGKQNPLSITRICRKMKMKRIDCLQEIDNALVILREKLQDQLAEWE